MLHPSGLEGSLRCVHVGDRPANEDGSVTAEGYTVLNVRAAYPVGAFTASAVVENVLDVAWNEAQFDTESRLPGEAVSVSELHFRQPAQRPARRGLPVLRAGFYRVPGCINKFELEDHPGSLVVDSTTSSMH